MTANHPRNFLHPVPQPRINGEEHLEDLLHRPGIRLERIVSHGQSSPPGFWYDQDEDEWVAVIQGEATLRFEAPEEHLTLRAGDHLLIPAHRRHRVESTATPTIWLALWMRPEDPS